MAVSYSSCIVLADQQDPTDWKPLKAVLHVSVQSTLYILGPQQIFVNEIVNLEAFEDNTQRPS